MGKVPPVEGPGQKIFLYRRSRTSPDLEIKAGDRQTVLFVLQRQGQLQEHGPDRRWNNLLVDGSTMFDANAPSHILKVVRVVEDELMQLWSYDGQLLTEIIRVVRGKGYGYPDLRHRCHWQGRSYLFAAHKVFTGKNLSCVDESTGQAVISYKTSLLPATQVGQMVISSKVQGYDLAVLMGAFLAYQEWDARRSLLIFGDWRFNNDVTP